MPQNSEIRSTIEQLKNGLRVPSEVVRLQLLVLDPQNRQATVKSIARAIFDSSTLASDSPAQYHTLETEYAFRAKHLDWDIQLELLKLIAPAGQVKSQEKICTIVSYLVDYTAEQDPNMLEALVVHAQRLGEPTGKVVRSKVWELAINDMLVRPEYSLGSVGTQQIPKLLDRTAEWTQQDIVLEVLAIVCELSCRISTTMASGYIEEKAKHRKLTQKTLLTIAQKSAQDVNTTMTDTLVHTVEHVRLATQTLIEVLIENGADWDQVKVESKNRMDESTIKAIENHPDVRKKRLENVVKQHLTTPSFLPGKRNL